MCLADFILRETDSIVENWESFARRCVPAASGMTDSELRDNARQILQAIALDLRTDQSPEEQKARSEGLAPVPLNAAETAAQTHAVLRARSGFDIGQLVAEYRALRASVLRMACEDPAWGELPLSEVVRFNESIDAALAESVAFYTAQVERSRDLLLGMLGHDMRSPLQAMRITASYLEALHAGAEVSDAATRLIRSGSRMQSLLDGLVDFNRTKLGLGININLGPCDLGEHCVSELEELRTVCPRRVLELSVRGDCHAVSDGDRIEQLVGNLVINAVKYGAPDAPIRVTVVGTERDVTIEVVNQGLPEDPAQLSTLFEPLERGNHSGAVGEDGLGLGLFIVREIASAHGGSVDARCTETETRFSVHLPKEPPARQLATA